MNDLLSKLFSLDRKNNSCDIEMCLRANNGASLEKFFKDVVKINRSFKEIDDLNTKLKVTHDELKKADNAGVLKALRSKMDHDMGQTLKKAKLIKDRLTALDKSNEASPSLPDCGPGSTRDCTRTPAVEVLGKKLNGKMEEFHKLRDRINEEYMKIFFKKVLHIDRGKS